MTEKSRVRMNDKPIIMHGQIYWTGASWRVFTSRDNERSWATNFTAAYCPVEKKMSVAVCSQQDQFCRKIGRDIAIGRLHKNKTLESLWNWVEHNEQSFQHIVGQIKNRFDQIRIKRQSKEAIK